MSSLRSGGFFRTAGGCSGSSGSVDEGSDCVQLHRGLRNGCRAVAHGFVNKNGTEKQIGVCESDIAKETGSGIKCASLRNIVKFAEDLAG